MEHFWGVDPVQLQEALRQLQHKKDSYTIGKISKEDSVSILRHNLPQDREQAILHDTALSQIKLLSEIEHLLPPFQATFTPNDNPELVIDHMWKSAALEAVRQGTGTYSSYLYNFAPDH